MRKFLLLGLVLALPAWANVKLGYVDLQRALREVAEGQQARQKLEKEIEKRKKELEAEENKIKNEQENFQKQAAMMSETARGQKLAELQATASAFFQKAQKMQEEMAQVEQTELKKIFEKMDPIIAAIAQREGLTMMFEKTNSGLVWAPPSIDYTNELVRTYNEKHKGAATPAAKTPAKPGAPAK
ncbi:MAG: OmpH family outer membrane protein [Proteobacteria bacterium]|nr:OmpH family outer membrane protein [Cystobacterineae bacterium]MCL2259520.1 OmpH family outer membrane protein [Cystobacterineae bacterium]MCL2313999.1 OmpH family outer membrane protein [Pseudomonadota bacterium]